MIAITAWASSSNTPDSTGKAQWLAPPPFRWNYTRFAKPGAYRARLRIETFDMTFAKDNAAEEGFNRWTINGVAFPMTTTWSRPSFHLKQGKRYRLRMRNASDDIHPIHLHRHSFELTNLAGKPTAGVLKDVVMVGGYQESRDGFRRRQSRPDPLPLPPATAHGLRLHDPFRLRLMTGIVSLCHPE